MELYLRSVEFKFLLLPMTTVDVYHVERAIRLQSSTFYLVQANFLSHFMAADISPTLY